MCPRPCGVYSKVQTPIKFHLLAALKKFCAKIKDDSSETIQAMRRSTPQLPSKKRARLSEPRPRRAAAVVAESRVVAEAEEFHFRTEVTRAEVLQRLRCWRRTSIMARGFKCTRRMGVGATAQSTSLSKVRVRGGLAGCGSTDINWFGLCRVVMWYGEDE